MTELYGSFLRRRRFKRIALGTAAGLLAFFFLSMAAAATIFLVIFGRMEKPANSFEWTIEEIDRGKYPFREIEFSSGGAPLRGFLFSGGKDKGLIVLLAGAGDGAESHLAEALYFMDHGWAVLAFDGTGVRSSGGSGTRGLPQEKRDAEAVLEYLPQLPETEGLPVVLYGHSSGGYAAAVAMGCERVSGAVSIGGV